MKVVKYTLRFCILIVFDSGCSFLSKVPVLETNKSSNWKDCGICYQYSQVKLKTKSYQYDADSFLITICPSPKPGPNVLFGPPFVPIIPNPFLLLPANPNWKFFVDTKIDNKGRNLSLDLSKFQFYILKDTLTKPSLIRIIANKHYGEPEEFFHKYVDYKDSILNHNVLNINNPVIVRFEFSVFTTKVKRLIIRYDSIPDIKFKKRNKFFYKPFVFAS